MAKIAHVVISGDMAGGQLIAWEIMKDRIGLGDEVVLVSPSEGVFTEQCRATMQVSLMPCGTLRDLIGIWRLVRFLRSVRPQLVHTHIMVPGNIMWRLACSIAGVPLIQHIHIANFFGPPGIKEKMVRFIDTLTARRATMFLPVSKHTGASIEAQGYPANRVRTVYNGVASSLPSTEQQENQPLIIGVVGRLCPTKGQMQAIEAFARVATDFPGARLWLVGKDQQAGGAYETTLRDRVTALGLEDMTVFWGHRSDVADLMKQMTMLVLPSAREALPLVLLEAMMLGVPVIASPVGGVPEIVSDGVTGLLVAPGDVKALANAVGRLLGDSALRLRLASAGRAQVEHEFCTERMLGKIREIYSEVLGVAN